jgi:predicted nucleic acid-binding protein
MPKVYIDTNIFKFSATELRRFVAKEVEPLQWGDITIDSPVYDIVSVNPNDKIPNEALKLEASLLQNVAEAAKHNIIDLVIHHETLLESWGIPNMDSQSGKFYGAPYEIIEGPIRYSRVVLGHNIDSDKAQYEFLRGIRHKRFIDIHKATGAYQGEKKVNKNQLIDAWNIWCAEHSQCQFLLTMDLKLIRMIKANKKWESTVSIVTPSKLLDAIQQT